MPHVGAAEHEKPRDGGKGGNGEKDDQPAGQGELRIIYCADESAIGSPREPV
jgi:hypothetical protein